MMAKGMRVVDQEEHDEEDPMLELHLD